MQRIVYGYRGLSLLANLYCDRILFLATILVALMLGGFIGSL